MCSAILGFSRSVGAGGCAISVMAVGVERTWPALRPTAMPDLCLTSFGILAVLSMGGVRDEVSRRESGRLSARALAIKLRRHDPLSFLQPQASLFVFHKHSRQSRLSASIIELAFLLSSPGPAISRSLIIKSLCLPASTVVSSLVVMIQHVQLR